MTKVNKEPTLTELFTSLHTSRETIAFLNEKIAQEKLAQEELQKQVVAAADEAVAVKAELVFVIDTSGSITNTNGLSMAREFVGAVVDMLPVVAAQSITISPDACDLEVFNGAQLLEAFQSKSSSRLTNIIFQGVGGGENFCTAFDYLAKRPVAKGKNRHVIIVTDDVGMTHAHPDIFVYQILDLVKDGTTKISGVVVRDTGNFWPPIQVILNKVQELADVSCTSIEKTGFGNSPTQIAEKFVQKLIAESVAMPAVVKKTKGNIPKV